MNSVLTFLERNRQQLDLQDQSLPEHLTSVVITPRFRASSHVVFLVMPEDRPEPLLVAKVPRLAEAGETLEREVANLRAIQASRPGGFNSVPQVIAFERCWERPILVETALVGEPLDPPTVRRDPDGACSAIVHWLIDVQLASRGATSMDDNWFDRLIGEPLAYVEKTLALSENERQMLETTWQLAETLRMMELPLVVEHGDLSHPNLILQEEGPGVVDWELADLQGLPACDLYFFLSYVAFARHRARSNGRHLEAFQRAFFGPETWVRTYIERYATHLELPRQALGPLFVLTWARYVAGLLMRLDGAGSQTVKPNTRVTAWLRNNRYFTLWRYAASHVKDLTASDEKD